MQFACWYETNHSKGWCYVLVMTLHIKQKMEVTLVLESRSAYSACILLLEKWDGVVFVLLAKPFFDVLSGQ